MSVDTKHPSYTDYNTAWEAAAGRVGSDSKHLAYDDYRAAKAARAAEAGLWDKAIELLDRIGRTSEYL